MEFSPIFGGEELLWCVSYPEDNGDDIFTLLFRQWNDTQYLIDFFTKHKQDLQNPYWQGISIDEAVDLVIEEAGYLQDKLICIEFPDDPGCKGQVKMSDIFEPFSKHNCVINVDLEYLVKGKLNSFPQMLRLYGVELNDGTKVISGGAIKISPTMGKKHLQTEKKRAEDLFAYLEYLTIKDYQDLQAFKKV